jgi:hypothetical protein
MARELADSVLHFLGKELGSTTPSTEQIAEVVVKVVRELGQPALARAFADEAGSKARLPVHPDSMAPALSAGAADKYGGRSESLGPRLGEIDSWVESGVSPALLAGLAGGRALHSYSLHEIYTKDLVAAHDEGLLTLTGLDRPLELAASAWPTPTLLGSAIAQSIEDARNLVGSFIAFDGPEYHLARLGVGRGVIGGIFQTLRVALRMVRLRAVVNLNSALPPPSAEELAVGPLFSDHQAENEAEQPEGWPSTLLEQILQGGRHDNSIGVDWHLGLNDFVPANLPRLLRVARRAQEGLPIAFVLDRPRRTVPLAEGVDRRHPAVLLAVKLHLPQLLQHVSAQRDPQAFLQKLGSLARLALSAATRRREFLRRQGKKRPALVRGFLLERARLVVVPVGLESVARSIIGEGLSTSGLALSFANSIIENLRSSLQQDARSCLLDACVDSPFEDRFAPPLPATAIDELAGLTGWDVSSTPRGQVQVAGALHATAESGTGLIPISTDQPLSPEEMVELLDYAWQHTDAIRIRFVSVSRPESEPVPFWER